MGATGVASQRKTIEESIERNKEKYIETSHDIHANPEIGNQEFYASRTLSLLLGSAGFQLRHNIAGHETGFIARKSSGKQGICNRIFSGVRRFTRTRSCVWSQFNWHN